jgi:galactokinase
MTNSLPQGNPPIRLARPEPEQIEALVGHLQRAYGVEPDRVRLVRAPLRICPLGAHIDHQLGVVTGMTLDQSILLAFVPTADGTIHLDSQNFSPALSFQMAEVPAYRPKDWGNYIRGAILALQQAHHLRHGLLGVVGGDMPVGGLSSSAAVTIAYLLALEAINEIVAAPAENVELVRFTENSYIGLNNGILDQSVILFSQAGHLTHIDCQTIQVETAPLAPVAAEFEILVVYSGVSQGLVGTDYNHRVAECQQAARLLLSYGGETAGQAPRLRQVAPAIFAAEGERLPRPLRNRAHHYFGEMARVQAGLSAWQQGDIPAFGRLVSQSGQSSIQYYECGSPQLITLYEILVQTAGVYGARFSGAGFRGNCIALIDPAARASIAEAVHRVYPSRHPAQAEAYSIHFCRSNGAAQLLGRSD